MIMWQVKEMVTASHLHRLDVVCSIWHTLGPAWWPSCYCHWEIALKTYRRLSWGPTFQILENRSSIPNFTNSLGAHIFVLTVSKL